MHKTIDSFLCNNIFQNKALWCLCSKCVFSIWHRVYLLPTLTEQNCLITSSTCNCVTILLYAFNIICNNIIRYKWSYSIMKKYYRIPLMSTTACFMVSYQLDYYTENYNIMYGFGGLELMTYNYTDAEWADFIAESNGALNYE